MAKKKRKSKSRSGQGVPALAVPDTHLTVKDCAHLLGITEKRALSLIYCGKLIEDKLPGVHTWKKLVRKDVLERFAKRMGIELREIG